MERQDVLLRTFVSLGLTETDAEVYLFLAKSGPQKGRDIAQALGLYKQQLYRSLRSLECKGCVKVAYAHPSRFFAVSIENVINLLVGANLQEAEIMEENRQKILSCWQAMMKKDQTE